MNVNSCFDGYGYEAQGQEFGFDFIQVTTEKNFAYAYLLIFIISLDLAGVERHVTGTFHYKINDWYA